MTHTALYDSSIGPITLTFDGESLTGLRFGKTNDNFASTLNAKHLSLNTTIRWLDIYFSGQQPDFLSPIKQYGTDFQLRIWQALLGIPYGETLSYGELAHCIGCRSAQAVGQAVSRNPISIIVPCHRVIGSDGSLVGYEWGLAKKQYLLQLEKQHNSI